MLSCDLLLAMVSVSRIDPAVDEVFRHRSIGLPEEDFMSDALSFVEIDGQRAELLPARTVLSLVSTCGCGGGGYGHGGGGQAGDGGNGGVGGNGGTGRGGLGINLLNVNLFGDQTNSAGNGTGGAGGSANGGPGGSVAS